MNKIISQEKVISKGYAVSKGIIISKGIVISKGNSISLEAKRLKKKYCTNDPFEIMKDLGINLIYNKFKTLKGFYVVELRERYITINSNLSERDMLIVGAHELGHGIAAHTRLKCLVVT